MCVISHPTAAPPRDYAAEMFDFDAKMHQTEGMESAASIFLSLTGAKSVRAIANHAGLDASTTNRQLTGKTALSIETVVAICRAFDIDFAEAFVAVDFITQDEASKLGDKRSLAYFTDLDLAKEIVRRLEEGEAGPELTEPLPAPGDDSNVIVGGFGNNADTGEDEIPENVEEEWAGQYAASPKSDLPEDHTP